MGAYCSRCGTQNSADSQFCIHCGGSLAPLPVTPQPVVAIATRYAGFWIRVIAAIIDAVLVQIVVVPVSMVVGMVIGLVGVATHSAGFGLQMFSGGLGGIIGLVRWMALQRHDGNSTRQATVGKMAFGMKVTDLQGQRLSFGLATGRHFAKILSGLILCIGFIMVGFTEKKQGLHDMIVGTLVRLP